MCYRPPDAASFLDHVLVPRRRSGKGYAACRYSLCSWQVQRVVALRHPPSTSPSIGKAAQLHVQGCCASLAVSVVAFCHPIPHLPQLLPPCEEWHLCLRVLPTARWTTADCSQQSFSTMAIVLLGGVRCAGATPSFSALVMIGTDLPGYQPR